jgi:hypothetical protein
MKKSLKLSIIVIVYRMPRQAMNTLYSLSAAYQRNADPSDYEIVVVENNSDQTINTAELKNLEGNFKYFLRRELGVSPAPAINFALEKCRGEMIGLIIDGARMLTPRVIAHVLSTRKIFPSPLVAVPGYHFGEDWHEVADVNPSIDEQLWLENINWKADGYRLFENACFSPGNRNGYFHPLMECTALFVHSQCFADIGGADEAFSLAGGGSLNLHIYRQLGLLPEQPLVILPGEANFHQYHGGVTTSAQAHREKLLQSFRIQLDERWGGQFKSLRREPILFGQIGATAQRFLESSCVAGMRRFTRLAEEGSDPWPDDRKNTGGE